MIADISEYQGEIDWEKANRALDMAIFRASIGHRADERYPEYAAKCKAPYGVYHYVKAGDAAQAREEAAVLVAASRAAGKEPCFYAADIEYRAQTRESTREVCAAFAEALRENGCKRIGLYTGGDWYGWAGDAVWLYDFVWIPRWGKNDGEIPPEEYAPRHPCALWQYTSRGRVPGIAGDVDLNTLRGGRTIKWFTGEDEGMFDPQRVIDIARGEIGYLEKRTADQLDDKTANAGANNYTKYSRDMDAIPGFYNTKKQGAAWCDIFVDWCFVQAYGAEDGRALLCQPLKSAGAGCRYSREYFAAKGQLFDSPAPGDQIFFWPKDQIGGPSVAHTGLVIAVEGDTVVTVEGNTSSASGVVDNGGGVWQKTYNLDYARIAGYGRPKWNSGSVEEHTNATIWSENGGWVNLRSGKVKADNVIATMNPGSRVLAEHDDGEWSEVTYGNIKGYAMSAFIRMDEPEKEPEKEPEPESADDYMLILRGSLDEMIKAQTAVGGALARVVSEKAVRG